MHFSHFDLNWIIFINATREHFFLNFKLYQNSSITVIQNGSEEISKLFSLNQVWRSVLVQCPHAPCAFGAAQSFTAGKFELFKCTVQCAQRTVDRLAFETVECGAPVHAMRVEAEAQSWVEGRVDMPMPAQYELEITAVLPEPNMSDRSLSA